VVFFVVNHLHHLLVRHGYKGEGSVRFRDFHKNVKTRIYVMFAFGTVQAMTFPFMAIYFAKSIGETTTGLLLTVSVAASMVSGAISGYYADRIGRKKLMVLSEAVFLLAYVLMAVANSPWLNSPWLTFVGFFVTNVCWGVYGPADEAMLLDVTTANNREFMYAIFYWVNNLTMAVGASIGAVFFESYRFELFGAMSVVVFASLMATVFLIEETHIPVKVGAPGHNPSVTHHGIIHNYVAVLRDSVFVRYVLAGVLVMATEFQLSNYIGIRLAKAIPDHPLLAIRNFVLHIDGVKMLGFLQTENTILVVVLAAFATTISRRFADKRVLAVGIFLQVLGYSVMTVTSSVILLVGAMLFATVGEVASVPARQAYLGDLAPSHARSSYVAVNTMAFGGSRILASLGVVLGVFTPNWMMGILSMGIGVLGLGLYLSVVNPALARRETLNSLST